MRRATEQARAKEARARIKINNLLVSADDNE